MPTSDAFASGFARCLDLFRDPAAKEAQKREFRALIGLLQGAAITLRMTGGRIVVNGAPCAGENLTSLVQRLDLHGIAEIVIPPNPLPADLFELLKSLADQPDAADVLTRYGTAGADRILVSSAPSGPEDYGSGTPVVPSPDAPVDRTAGTLGTGGILRGESLRDIASVPIRGVPLVTHDPLPPPAVTALPGEGDAAPPAPPPSPGELSLSVATPATPPPAPSPPPAGKAAPSAMALPSRIAAALAQLERSPTAPSVSDLLAGLVRDADVALKQNRMEQTLQIVVSIARIEQRVPEAGGMRRQYAIALNRVFTKPVLGALSHLVIAPRYRADAIVALQRAGAAAVEVLIDRLTAAATVGERRAVFDALRHMTEGTEQLIRMLEHPEWFVVRNVAELIGELGMEEAVPALAGKLEHGDERVRRAVALALAKIGTRSAAEPLRRALRDRSTEVRMQVALGIGGRKSFALAMPLVVALEEEKDEAVERELILALGRIGSPDAVQALIKFAQPTGRLFGRKPITRRLAAVEALRLAGTPPAVGTLEGLVDDGDREVREASRAALGDLKRKPR
jgi:HEAT repeat protein